MKQVLLSHWRAPGDIVCMTACVRDLALSYPGRYEIHVAGSCPDLWKYNPHISHSWGLRPPGDMPRHLLSCRVALTESSRTKLHYITAFHRDLSRKLRIPIPLLYAKGDLHLSEAETSERIVDDPYWLIVAGGKNDIPTKMWSTARFQQVVDRLHDEGVCCVQGGAQLPGHWHPELKNAKSHVGTADPRGFLRLIYGADGVICPVSFPMHVAAAFDKPCVVIAGGREPWWWEAYTNTTVRQFGGVCAPVAVPHTFLHSIGQLDCCRSTGCWKTRVLPNEPKSSGIACQQPTEDSLGQVIPRCLDEISVHEVVAAVLALVKGRPSVGDAFKPGAVIDTRGRFHGS